MKYPKWSLITAIRFLLGMHPFHEHRRSHWQKKVIVPGLVLTICHTILVCYTFYLEVNRVGYMKNNPNNVIQATIVLKRLLSVTTPLICFYGRFFYIKAWEEFWQRIDTFDKFLNSANHQRTVKFRCTAEDLEEKIQRTNFYCGLCVILIELFNYLTSYLYATFTPGTNVRLETVYFFHLALSTFISGSFYIFAIMHNMNLRLQLFTQFLDSIWSMGWNSGHLQTNRQLLFDNFLREQLLTEKIK